MLKLLYQQFISSSYRGIYNHLNNHTQPSSPVCFNMNQLQGLCNHVPVQNPTFSPKIHEIFLGTQPPNPLNHINYPVTALRCKGNQVDWHLPCRSEKWVPNNTLSMTHSSCRQCNYHCTSSRDVITMHRHETELSLDGNKICQKFQVAHSDFRYLGKKMVFPPLFTQ